MSHLLNVFIYRAIKIRRVPGVDVFYVVNKFKKIAVRSNIV